MNRSDTTPRSFSTDQLRAAFGDAEGPARPDYLPDIVAKAGRMRQRPAWTFLDGWISRDIALGRRGVPRMAVLFATLALLAILAAAGLYVGSRPKPPVHLGIFEPVTSRIACKDQDREAGSVLRVTGTVLGCSRDGTRLLLQKDRENLFILHADGSETQVTEQLSGFNDIPGSARPSGATISPDGSRVVFAGLTKPWQDGRSCHDGALFAVDADGGPPEMIWRSERDGIVRHPTFSPDGTRIAFVDDYCDSDHSVWLMNADGSDAHKILVGEDVGLGAGHVSGLAWSAAGDRIKLVVQEGGWYSFAPDGSDVQQVIGSEIYCWPGLRC